MKTALCVFGQPRTMEFCFPSLKKHILDVYNPDVFVASDSQGDRIKELYHPVAIEIHSPNEENQIMGEHRLRYGVAVPFPEVPQCPISPPANLSYMFKGWRCRELLKAHELIHGKYDVIIATRFDAKFLYIQPVIMPEENCVYVPRIDACQNPINKFGLHANGVFGGVGYGGQIFWGSSDIVKGILDSYNWSDVCFKEINRWCGEMMFKWFCDKNNIKVKYTDVTFMLIRGDNAHPRSHEGGVGNPLSATNYPEYL